MKNDSLEEKLIVDFHTQFASNQNHHQSLVIKFFGGISLLFVTFVYATLYNRSYLIFNDLVSEEKFSELILTKGKFIITDGLYLWYSLIVCIILALAFGYLLQVSYIFRRDQSMASKIRVIASGECGKLFANYGQLKPKLLWPPDQFLILLLTVLMLMVGIIFYILFGCIYIEKFHFKTSFIIPLLLIILFCINYHFKYKKIL